MEQSSESRQLFILFKEKIQGMNFTYFRFDNELILNKDSLEIIDFIKNEFYFKQRYKSKKFYSIKKFIFDMDYRSHPEKYPDLIYKENIKIENLSHAVPGNSIDSNLFIGYFKEIKKPSGEYFTNIFSENIKPVNQNMESIVSDIKTILESMKTAADNSSEQLQVIEANYRDLINLFSICEFIAESLTTAKSENLQPLKSGHLISFLSGMCLYFKELEMTLTEYGLAVVSLNNDASLVNKIHVFSNQLDSILDCFSIDLVSPLFLSMNCRVEAIDGKIRLIDNDELQRDIYSRIFDFFLNLFKYKENKTFGKNRNILNERNQFPRQTTSNREASNNPDNKLKNKIAEDTIIDSRLFIELYTALSKFIERLKLDLAPIISEDGELLHNKLGFDQFDVPDHARSANFDKIKLPGKSSKKYSSNRQSSDQMIIKSTYWLYDRITNIIKYYHFSKEGILLENAKNFTGDVKTLFFPLKTEYNDIRTYGTFSQFKINIKYLFVSATGQSKFLNHINYIAELLDNAKSYLLNEESRINQNHPE